MTSSDYSDHNIFNNAFQRVIPPFIIMLRILAFFGLHCRNVIIFTDLSNYNRSPKNCIPMTGYESGIHRGSVVHRQEVHNFVKHLIVLKILLHGLVKRSLFKNCAALFLVRFYTKPQLL